MNFPIEPDSPEDLLAQAIAKELAIVGIDPEVAYTTAIRIMKVCQIGHNEPSFGVWYIQEQRKQDDTWWTINYPLSLNGIKAQQRLTEQTSLECLEKFTSLFPSVNPKSVHIDNPERLDEYYEYPY